RGEEMMRMGLVLDRRAAFDDHALGQSLMAMGSEAMTTVAPFFLATLVAALLAPLLLSGGWVFSPKALTFKPERLDPLEGLEQFSAARKQSWSWHPAVDYVLAKA
ncbi:MAG: EscU/YscU/HrcU family type III secretion system export apparatus switch protein, partial [Rhodocyclaceae bacterium]